VVAGVLAGFEGLAGLIRERVRKVIELVSNEKQKNIPIGSRRASNGSGRTSPQKECAATDASQQDDGNRGVAVVEGGARSREQ